MISKKYIHTYHSKTAVSQPQSRLIHHCITKSYVQKMCHLIVIRNSKFPSLNLKMPFLIKFTSYLLYDWCCIQVKITDFLQCIS